MSLPAERAVVQEHGFHTLSVKGIIRETADTLSYVLEVPASLQHTFAYRPGQFCTFRARIDETPHLRSYSMSSAPETDPDLTVTVKRMPGGLVSNWLHDHLGEGDVVELTKPAGVFCPRDTDRPIVAFCGGSGVTPVMSIVKSVLATSGRRIRLLYANRDEHSVIFGDDLARLAAGSGDRLEVHHHLDADAGFLEASDIGDFASASSNADFYICGPGPFMELVEATLHRLGVEPGRIFIERFVVDEEPSGQHVEEETEEATHLGAEGEQAPATLTVIIEGKSTSVPYRPGDTVLETARRGALRPPSSCEAGECATCMAILRKGSAAMRVNNALSAEEVEEGWILTCQALPKGEEVTVEYEDM